MFAGSLWAWNTAPTNTSNGLDGPTSLRMSDANNPNSWNPINQAFLDKDDGSEGSGLSPFTISGFGIPPEGSLVAFKQFAGYQIVRRDPSSTRCGGRASGTRSKSSFDRNATSDAASPDLNEPAAGCEASRR